MAAVDLLVVTSPTYGELSFIPYVFRNVSQKDPFRNLRCGRLTGDHLRRKNSDEVPTRYGSIIRSESLSPGVERSAAGCFTFLTSFAGACDDSAKGSSSDISRRHHATSPRQFASDFTM